MGCKNSPAYFQNQLANTVLPGLLYQICELYIDDVLVFGNTPAELLRNVTKVLERFRKHNIIANPKKIRCGMSEIEHTGYLLNENGFTFSREKLDMVEHFDRPVLVKDLKSFLGLANHFRSVVQNHSLLAGPLDKLCANYQAARYSKVKWTVLLVDTNMVLQRIFVYIILGFTGLCQLPGIKNFSIIILICR